MNIRLKQLDWKRMCALGLWGALSFFPQSAFAQINQALPDNEWRYQLSLTGNVLYGNVNRNLLISDALSEYLNNDWGSYHRLNWQWGTFANQWTENDLVSRNFVYLWPRATYYPYFMAWLETNLRRRIQGRIQLGPGMTWQVLQADGHQLKLSGTLTAERTLFQGQTFAERADLTQNVLDTARLTFRAAGKSQLAEPLRLDYEAWVQPSLLDVGNLRAHLELGLSWKLQQNLALKSSFLYTYEAVRLEKVAANDILLTFGFLFQSE